MRPVTVIASGVASSAVVVPDYMLDPFNIGIAVKVTGTINYTVEHTFDDVYDANAVLTWFPNTSLTAQTASKDGNYAFPVRGIRITNASGSGSTSLTVVQAG